MDEVVVIPGLESIYLITHDVDLALTRADRILVLRDGRVVADGPPVSVIQDEERWRECNLHRTSLIRANLAWPPVGGGLLDASTLARQIVAAERSNTPATEGGSKVEQA